MDSNLVILHHEVILLATLIVIATSYASLLLLGKHDSHSPRNSMFWLFSSSLTFSLGFWIANCVGMMAFQFTTVPEFDKTYLVLSLIVMFLFSSTSFILIKYGKRVYTRLLVTSTMLTLGSFLMHLIGLQALDHVIHVEYEEVFLLFAFIIGLVLFLLSMRNAKLYAKTLMASVQMGFGFLLLHCLTLFAGHITPVHYATNGLLSSILTSDLQIILSFTVLFIIGFSLFTWSMDRKVAYLAQLEVKTIRENEERFKALTLHAFDITLILNKDGNIVYETPSVERLLGYTQSEVVGTNCMRFVAPSDRQQLAEFLTQVLTNPDRVFEQEFRVLHADGSTRYFHISGKNLLDHPAINGIVINKHDVTELKGKTELLIDRNIILELVANAKPLEEILNEIIHIIEKRYASVQGVFLLGDSEDDLRMITPYFCAINDLDIFRSIIGGTAILKGESIYQSIENDPSWNNYKEYAKSNGWKTCSMFPIFGSNQEILGTLIMFAQQENKVMDELNLLVGNLLSAATIAIEKSRSEEAFRKSEALYRLLAENASDLIVMLDSSGKTKYVSPSQERILGKVPNLGCSRIEMIHPDDQFHVQQEFSRCLAERTPIRYECRLQHANGEWIFFESNAMPILNEYGEIDTIVVFTRDITLRKKEENYLREQEEQYRLLFAANPNPMWVFDEETLAFLLVNDAAIEHYGYSLEEFLSMTIKDIRLPEDEEKMLQEFNSRKGDSDYAPPTLHRHRKKNGEIIDVEISSHGLLFSGQEARVVLSIDVTNRLKAERQLSLARDLALQASNVKSSFLANMSHEIRTPLHAIIGMTELLAESPLGNEQKEYVKVCEIASTLLLHLVNNILDLSKIEAGHLILDEDDFSVTQLVQNVSELLMQSANKKGLDLQVHIASEIPACLKGDSLRLQQVLINLVGNAIKYTEVGTISVRVNKGTAENMYQFEIVDTGIGIPVEKHTEVFEMFTQADAKITRKYGGTGLGLSISKRIIEAMGGNVWLESEEGKGTTVSFTVQLEMGQRTEIDPIPTQATIFTKPLKIMLVDDAIDNRRIIQGFLQEVSPQLITAENGEQAVQLYHSGEYDLILMDMQMPVMDGYTATRKIREAEVTNGRKKIPIIAVTAFALKEEQDACIVAGCNGFITKPINRKTLLQELAKYVPTGTMSKALPRKINVAIQRELEDLIPGFLQNRRTDIIQIRQSKEKQDHETIRLLGHSMKGFGSAYGFDDISTLGRTLEGAAIRRDWSTIEQTTDQLETYLDRVDIVFVE